MGTCCDDEETGLPQTYDFVSRLTGDTWQGIVFTITVNDDPLDLTGCVVEIAFKKSNLTTVVDLLLSTATSDITIAANVITIEPRILTLLPGKYVYDMQITFPDDSVKTYVKGTFKVLRDVTP